jgi:hypothetical protein
MANAAAECMKTYSKAVQTAAALALSLAIGVAVIVACNTQPSAKHGGGPEITLPQPHASAPSIKPSDFRGADIPGPMPNIESDAGESGEDAGTQ